VGTVRTVNRRFVVDADMRSVVGLVDSGEITGGPIAYSWRRIGQLEDRGMKINWGRVVNAGLVAEILLLFVYQIVVWRFGRGTASTVVVVGGCFVFMLLGALWVARKIESRFILHGFLVGVVAVAYYVVRSLPDVLRGQYPSNYWLAALYGHTPKLLGGIVGGWIAGKRRSKGK
jgi:hypothetical protein